MAEGRHLWTYSETMALIDAWEKRYNLLKGQRRTAHLHEEIKQVLHSKNIQKSVRQIVIKIDNLTQKYRKTLPKSNPSWIYFKRLDKFMRGTSENTEEAIVHMKSERSSSDQPEYTDVSNEAYGSHQNLANISILNVEGNAAMRQFEGPGHYFHSKGKQRHYLNEMLSIIYRQIEVQKQAICIQEKFVTMVSQMINDSSND
ncbi:uncharacterized protein LOC118200517 [Stegodyphus dumicola]|uniref:uncharacterized protein LOC118200517 n=1 Tax=Stegodyphus dumicola TaxID=202533 RepID=UPI0015AE2B18|nr:uncharacterized protein LOC118200517 [Stegodyphus dumicola]